MRKRDFISSQWSHNIPRSNVTKSPIYNEIHTFSQQFRFILSSQYATSGAHNRKIVELYLVNTLRKRFRGNGSVRISRSKSKGGSKKLNQDKFLGILNKASAESIRSPNTPGSRL